MRDGGFRHISVGYMILPALIATWNIGGRITSSTTPKEFNAES